MLEKPTVSGCTKPGFAILFLMILTLTLPLGFMVEDFQETAYDESEAAPYEGSLLFSIAVSPAAARMTQGLSSCSRRLKLGNPSWFPPARVHDIDANWSTDARASLTLLCTLLC